MSCDDLECFFISSVVFCVFHVILSIRNVWHYLEYARIESWHLKLAISALCVRIFSAKIIFAVFWKLFVSLVNILKFWHIKGPVRLCLFWHEEEHLLWINFIYAFVLYYCRVIRKLCRSDGMLDKMKRQNTTL
jgi:hypothetical protein